MCDYSAMVLRILALSPLIGNKLLWEVSFPLYILTHSLAPSTVLGNHVRLNADVQIVHVVETV